MVLRQVSELKIGFQAWGRVSNKSWSFKLEFEFQIQVLKPKLGFQAMYEVSNAGQYFQLGFEAKFMVSS